MRITRALRPIHFVLYIALLARAWAAAADAGVSYTVALVSPEKHLVEVEVRLPPGAAQRQLQMPVWNALYQVRDFAQFINWIRVKDSAGNPLPLRTLTDSSWQIEGAAQGATVEYQISLDSFGPFGAQLNTHHAFFNLAQVLMYPVDGRDEQMTVRFRDVRPEWHVAMPLPSQSGTYSAANYDRLVDSPVEIGDFHAYDFEEGGAQYHVIVGADPADYTPDKILASLRQIVAAATSWMNDRPFEAYTFFYHFPRGPAGGGMEHAYSTAIELNAVTIQRSLYPFNAVTAHEFFHLWNVKRIRPRTLEPIDYTKENFTRALWFSEGVTSTVEEIIELRAGLIDEKQFLSHLGEQISELESRPAHLTQSAEESSLDAWLEGFDYYRRPERSISYYNKGELLGFMLDLAIRDASRDHASLRELFQWMNANYAKRGLFFDDSSGVLEAADAVSHADLAQFFTKYVAGTEEIPWNDFLNYVGLRVEPVTIAVPDLGFVASRNFDGPLSVVDVSPGSDAARAGLQVGDIITEVLGKAASEESNQQMSRLNAGDTISLKIRSGRGKDRELKWKIAGRQEVSYMVKDLDEVTPEQRVHRVAWLKGEAEPAVASTEQHESAVHALRVDERGERQ
ncbi:MAG TPA: PDZ domain-containing protein [Dongiaceae bacterium]|nr:PDZ domain-containing protein [Dongiaceae bacterium]